MNILRDDDKPTFILCLTANLNVIFMNVNSQQMNYIEGYSDIAPNRYLYFVQLQEMHGTWLEQVRSNMQSIQILQNAIVSEMLAIQDNPKEKSISQHRINNFSTLLQERAKYILNFIKEESNLKREELAVIEGQRSLKATQKKKPNDVIWQNFYDRGRELREQFKKQQSTVLVHPKNTVAYYRDNVFLPPFKEPEFSLEENKGKYVDMHSIYMEFLNLCKVMEEGKETTRLHDYLWFLQNMDKFDEFPINKKYKHQSKYITYLEHLYEYLSGFIHRAKPLFDAEPFWKNIKVSFEEKYKEGKVVGWDQHNQHIDQDKMEYCANCKKLFITNEAFVSHLMGKKHLKLSKSDNIVADPEEEAKARELFREEAENRKKHLAYLQFRISKLREELASTIYDTMNLIRKKQSRGYEQIDENEEQSSESEEADAPIYNPKNLPLGWDGKPIPYWLYKLHGLGIEFKCQICGNYSYWGRRAFEMHFQEWRHTYGMKCLKIPNTIHFKDITTINDALALHEKLVRESQEGQFRADVEEEFEDGDGNVLTKKTYLDMKKQGLIH